MPRPDLETLNNQELLVLDEQEIANLRSLIIPVVVDILRSESLHQDIKSIIDANFTPIQAEGAYNDRAYVEENINSLDLGVILDIAIKIALIPGQSMLMNKFSEVTSIRKEIVKRSLVERDPASNADPQVINPTIPVVNQPEIPQSPSLLELQPGYTLTRHYVVPNNILVSENVQITRQGFEELLSTDATTTLLENRNPLTLKRKINSLGALFKTSISRIFRSDTQPTNVAPSLEVEQGYSENINDAENLSVTTSNELPPIYRFSNEELVFEILENANDLQRQAIIDYLAVGIQTTISNRLTEKKFEEVSSEKPWSVVEAFDMLFHLKAPFEELPANSFSFVINSFKNRINFNPQISDYSSLRFFRDEEQVLDPLNLNIGSVVIGKINQINPDIVKNITTNLVKQAFQEIYDLLSNPTEEDGEYKTDLRSLCEDLEIDLEFRPIGKANLETPTTEEFGILRVAGELSILNQLRDELKSLINDTYKRFVDIKIREENQNYKIQNNNKPLPIADFRNIPKKYFPTFVKELKDLNYEAIAGGFTRILAKYTGANAEIVVRALEDEFFILTKILEDDTTLLLTSDDQLLKWIKANQNLL